MTGEGGGRREGHPRWWLVLGLICASSIGLLLSACGDTSDPEPERPTALFRASVTVVSDEIWVHGGLAAPIGTSPPVTSVIPPGWVPNRTVIKYAVSGSVEEVITLPALEHPVAFSRVLASGDRRYLLGSICRGAGGCGRETDPVLMALEGPDARPIPLELQTAAFADDVGAELLTPLGAAEGLGWTLQGLGAQGSGYGGLADRHRLLAVDLETGVGTEVPLPDGVYGEQLVCMGEQTIFAAQAEVTPEGQVQAVRIYRHDARTPGPKWELLVDLPMTRDPITQGRLDCLEGTQELLLSVGSTGADALTLAMSDGQEAAPPVTLPHVPSTALGTSDGEAVLLTLEDEQQVLWRHRNGLPWAPEAGVTVPQGGSLILVDGRLYDAAPLHDRLHLEGTNLPVIPGWQPMQARP